MPKPATNPDVTVVIPVHNEVQALPELVSRLTETLRAHGKPFKIIFVDDASTDGSTDLLKAMAGKDPRVGLIVLAVRCGQLGATLTGMSHARGDRVVTMDADLSHPPEAVPRLLTALTDDFDVIFALREGEGGPGTLSRLARLLGRWVFGVRLPRDVSTFRAFRGDLARELGASGGGVVMIAAELCRRGARTGYLPVETARRRAGQSKYTLRRKLRLACRAVAAYGCRPWRWVFSPWCGGPEGPCPVQEAIGVEGIAHG
jgi:dolichol-phosphate mannosyltransferase